MSETAVLPTRARRGRREFNRHRNRVAGIKRCATCRGTRSVRKSGNAGFCAGCLDRSRLHDDDDLGGEA